MNNKYLPIGTVCTLNANNKKMMVLGYSYPKYTGKLEISDYVGIPYPEGMLLPNQITAFQASDIANVDYMGYTNEEYRAFRSQMEGHKVSPYQFDANGVVIHDASAEAATPPLKRTYEFDENGVVIFDPAVELATRDEPVDRSYQFDVRKDQPASSNLYEFDKNGVVTQDRTNSSKGSYLFDANGVVVADLTTTADDSNKYTPRYNFDSNGVVTADYSIPTPEVKDNSPRYQFDTNGIVIEDMSSQIEEEYNKQKSSHYEFDSNGVVTADFA